MVTKTAVAWVVQRSSFFALGPVKTLVAFFVAKIVRYIVYETELAIFLAYTDVRVGAQGRAFSAAAFKNVEVQNNGTPEEKAASEKELINLFTELAKFRN